MQIEVFGVSRGGSGEDEELSVVFREPQQLEKLPSPNNLKRHLPLTLRLPKSSSGII